MEDEQFFIEFKQEKKREGAPEAPPLSAEEEELLELNVTTSQPPVIEEAPSPVQKKELKKVANEAIMLLSELRKLSEKIDFDSLFRAFIKYKGVEREAFLIFFRIVDREDLIKYLKTVFTGYKPARLAFELGVWDGIFSNTYHYPYPDIVVVTEGGVRMSADYGSVAIYLFTDNDGILWGKKVLKLSSSVIAVYKSHIRRGLNQFTLIPFDFYIDLDREHVDIKVRDEILKLEIESNEESS
ncbi:MAG: hypothetical protein ABWK01_06925 [Infirmifilum sp.]